MLGWSFYKHPASGLPRTQPSSRPAGFVLIRFSAMEFTSAVLLASKLTSKILSAGTLAKVGGAASGSILAGLPSMGLTLSSNAALAGATSTLGSLLGYPAAALTAFPLGAKAAAAAVGGAVAVGAVPLVLGTVGFTGAGITASSLAAKMMSAAAIANGGGVASGGLVATLQSVGAAGLSLSSKVVLGFAGSALVSRVVGL